MTEHPPDNADAPALVEQGIQAYRAGDRRRARQLLTTATQRDPRNEIAWLWLSAAHDDVEFRRICLQRVLAINPRNADARRGLQLLESEPSTKPVSVFSPPPSPATSAPVEPPARPPVATLRARPMEPVLPKCPWCGAEFTRTLLDRCPRCGRHLEIDCPACERHVPLTAEACPYCQHAFGKFHVDRESYLAQLADDYRAKGWVDQALGLYDYLTDIAPNRAEYHQRIAQLYDQIGDVTRSVNAYQHVLDLDPNNAEALAQLARWYLILHQAPELKDIGRRLRLIKNRSLRLTVLLGDVDYECEQYKSAEQIYRQLLGLRDLDAATRARLHFRLGEIQRERGNLARAVHAYEASLAAGVSTEETQAARRRLDELRPPLPLYALSSYGETLRAMAGPVLLLWTTAALQVGYHFERLTIVSILGLVLSVLGSYLMACALVTPLTLEWREMLGPAGLSQPVLKQLVAIIGGGLLAAAVVLVLYGI